EAGGPIEGAAKPDGAIANFGRVPFHNGSRIHASELSPDGKLLATLSSRSATVWNTTTGQLLHRFFFDVPAWPVHVGVPAFSPDSKRLACRVDARTFVVWDLTTGKEAKRLITEANEIGSDWSAFLRFSTDGKALVAQVNQDAVWLSIDTGAVIRRLGKRW